MANALAQETSPYLLQHAGNPVDWLPWGETAFARAREQDRALLVSIGYSACHWCHVMERECFEDPEIAALMNELFVCVKVDREERPDVDALYMDAVQAMTGQGGWPLNAFIAPDGHPFFAGTYFPPEPRGQLASWPMVLRRVSQAWREQRAEIDATREKLLPRLGGVAWIEGRSAPDVPDDLLPEALAGLRAAYDQAHGGFGTAPKFPAHAVIEFLLGQGERAMAVHTLRAMANGGIYDQVGGGFARYSVDAAWVVPHFEKMLYDNALLARQYLHGWQLTHDRLLHRVCVETLEFLLRELRVSDGGFAAALDADTEGVEGQFYVWSADELRDVAGEAAVAYFGATAAGNWEGTNVLVRAAPDPPELAAWKAALRERREQRVRPGLDDKRLTAWNALAIAALADAGAALGRADFLDAARDTAAFVLERLRDEPGRLLRTFNRGQARLNAYLEDHGYLLDALLVLYQATFEERWFQAARELADETIFRFGDPGRGGFFTTAHDHEQLLVKRKEIEDAPIPSGQSAVALGLLKLAALTGEHAYAEQAQAVFRPLADPVKRFPTTFGHLLQAIAFDRGPVREVAIAGDDAGLLLDVVRAAYRPNVVVAGGAGDAVPLLAGRTPVDGRAAAYVCEGSACQAPVTEPDGLAKLLQDR